MHGDGYSRGCGDDRGGGLDVQCCGPVTARGDDVNRVGFPEVGR